ncbi:outer membrane protein [Candidatus Berkiella aquae]|uniref:Outer membrane beta-barrel protein n=1 Tax=Candidatus Berkiella aquae TaxID=295108 RepID=A0A0Q9Z0S3_9GAMM|nr:outer membrane beta-barrel protein [Candidatus Berkiella aquae]MCS5711994.1 outer membrane beta-barrel protein [Candidatus Berkiella aquae]
MKKLGIAICLSSALLAANAQAWEGNWLLGVSGGYAEREGSNSFTFLSATPLAGRQSTISHKQQDNGWIGGVFGGYQMGCERWLLGLELNLDWRDYDDALEFAFTDLANVGWAVSYNYERDWVLGLTARVGYEFTPYLLPYARFGVEYSRDKLKVDAQSSLNAVAHLDNHRNSYRPVIGLGAELPMSGIPVINNISFLSHLAVRMEYDYHGKGRKVTTGGTASDNGSISSSMSPYEQSAIVSLVYNI